MVYLSRKLKKCRQKKEEFVEGLGGKTSFTGEDMENGMHYWGKRLKG